MFISYLFLYSADDNDVDDTLAGAKLHGTHDNCKFEFRSSSNFLAKSVLGSYV